VGAGPALPLCTTIIIAVVIADIGFWTILGLTVLRRCACVCWLSIGSAGPGDIRRLSCRSITDMLTCRICWSRIMVLCLCQLCSLCQPPCLMLPQPACRGVSDAHQRPASNPQSSIWIKH